MGGGDSHASGVEKRSGISEQRDAQCLEGQPDTLRKGTGNGAVYHKIGKENRVLKIQTLAGNEVGTVGASKESLSKTSGKKKKK